ncbi:hypothetical protein N7465_002099 [Penicillium sp. CMV-2018d]|nr:hypothetical protein N7465_002099 [Penicillium sp. CMV-2018d]
MLPDIGQPIRPRTRYEERHEIPDTPVARKVLEISASVTGQHEEDKTDVRGIEACFAGIDGIATFALRKVVQDIQKEADSIGEHSGSELGDDELSPGR